MEKIIYPILGIIPFASIVYNGNDITVFLFFVKN